MGLAAAFAASGVLAQVAPPDLQARIVDCEPRNLSWLACAQGIERQALSVERDVVRSPGLLSIRTPGRTVRLADERDEQTVGYTTLVHSYLGRVGPARHHLVLRIHHEHSVHLLIHASSGRSAQMPAYPVASPDGRHFVVASEDLVAGFQPNVVEIWSASANAFRREAQFKPSWGPRAAFWTGHSNLSVSKVCPRPMEEPAPCGSARIVLDKGRWRMSE